MTTLLRSQTWFCSCPQPLLIHFVCRPVMIHQFADRTLGISYQGRLLAR
jgi:hypothetical protein